MITSTHQINNTMHITHQIGMTMRMAIDHFITMSLSKAMHIIDSISCGRELLIKKLTTIVPRGWLIIVKETTVGTIRDDLPMGNPTTMTAATKSSYWHTWVRIDIHVSNRHLFLSLLLLLILLVSCIPLSPRVYHRRWSIDAPPMDQSPRFHVPSCLFAGLQQYRQLNANCSSICTGQLENYSFTYAHYFMFTYTLFSPYFSRTITLTQINTLFCTRR